jgi:hypothetical protein
LLIFDPKTSSDIVRSSTKQVPLLGVRTISQCDNVNVPNHLVTLRDVQQNFEEAAKKRIYQVLGPCQDLRGPMSGLNLEVNTSVKTLHQIRI